MNDIIKALDDLVMDIEKDIQELNRSDIQEYKAMKSRIDNGLKAIELEMKKQHSKNDESLLKEFKVRLTLLNIQF